MTMSLTSAHANRLYARSVVVSFVVRHLPDAARCNVEAMSVVDAVYADGDCGTAVPPLVYLFPTCSLSV
jgi:hypothetical protein